MPFIFRLTSCNERSSTNTCDERSITNAKRNEQLIISKYTDPNSINTMTIETGIEIKRQLQKKQNAKQKA